MVYGLLTLRSEASHLRLQLDSKVARISELEASSKRLQKQYENQEARTKRQLEDKITAVSSTSLPNFHSSANSNQSEALDEVHKELKDKQQELTSTLSNAATIQEDLESAKTQAIELEKLKSSTDLELQSLHTELENSKQQIKHLE
eukprot:scaffold132145_cov44-Prasinocladus_malaysianus.AAC.1